MIKAKQYATHKEKQAYAHICYIKEGKGRIPLQDRGHRSTLRLRCDRHVAAYVKRIKFVLFL
jgi:hypothetical protein